MFDAVARRYDLVNRILSFGLDRRWRRAAVRAARPRRGGVVLDVGCGTGGTGRLLAARCTVVGIDLSFEILRRARRGTEVQHLVQGSAFRLPFADSAFDGAVSAFLLRNLEDLGAAFAELARVTASHATVALVDLTEPTGPVFRRLFDAYFSRAAPALGRLAGNADAYRYLVRSLGRLPGPKEMRRLLGEAGFDDARARPMTGGVVTIFTARRR